MPYTDKPLIPLVQDVSYASRIMACLLRHPSSLRRIFRGAQAMDQFFQQVYAKDPVSVKRTHGFEIYLNPEDKGISPSIGVLGWYELRTTELFERILSEGDTVVDVGANIGFFTMLAAKIVGPKGRVVSFEPEPVSFSLLSRSVQSNRFTNVELVQKCASEVDGEKRLYLSSTGHKGMHSIVRDSGGSSIIVPSVRLDSEISRIGLKEIDLLKVDAEGAEPEILMGAIELLSHRTIKNLILEWEHPTNWLAHRDLVSRLLREFDGYLVSRSLPFLPVKKIGPNMSLQETFSNRYGTNLYLRLRD